MNDQSLTEIVLRNKSFIISNLNDKILGEFRYVALYPNTIYILDVLSLSDVVDRERGKPLLLLHLADSATYTGEEEYRILLHRAQRADAELKRKSNRKRDGIA